MKRAAFILASILAVTAVQAQQMQFINDLADKKVVTFGDAVTIFMYTLGREPAGFNADVAALKGRKLLKLNRYDKAAPLRRGMIALMAARHLKLKGSLFYLMFDTQRYAHRACVAEGLMSAKTSEFDKLTGDELLEFIAAISARMEENK
jgi:hypothetical protein